MHLIKIFLFNAFDISAFTNYRDEAKYKRDIKYIKILVE